MEVVCRYQARLVATILPWSFSFTDEKLYFKFCSPVQSLSKSIKIETCCCDEFGLAWYRVLTVRLSQSLGDDNGDLKIDELEEGETTPQEKAKKQQQQQQQQQQHKIIVEG